jgi:UrcA family protein
MTAQRNRRNILKLTVSALLGFAAAIAATAAARAADLPAIQVSVGDLDLSRPADVDVLYGRLQLAAMGACLPLPQQSLRYADWQRCYEAVLASAVRRMHSPDLLVRYRQSEPAVRAPERRG